MSQMNSYRFILEDYHAIKNADIILDGLTVLAGLNGCGKSTISRWLYGFVKYSNDFDRIVDTETAGILFERNRRLSEVERRIAFWTKSNILPPIPRMNGNLDDEVSSFQERVKGICDSIRRDMTIPLMDKYGNQLWTALGISDTEGDLEAKLDAFVGEEHKFLSDILLQATARKSECSLADLYRMIEEGLNIQSKGPMHMQLCENGTELLDHDYEYVVVGDGVRLVDNGKYIVTDKILGRFLAPMGLKRAIYIDSPMAVSNQSEKTYKIWDELMAMLRTPLKPMPEAARRIVMEISLTLGGDVLLKDERVGSKEL